MTHAPDPAMTAILDRLRRGPAVDYRAMPMAAARATFEELARPWNDPAPVAETRDLTMPGAAGPMRARLHRATGDGPSPLVLFVHGGGWTFGSIDTHDGTMRHLARESGCAVLGIDYRLAPEHPFPAPLDDVLAAIRFVRAGGLGADIDAGRLALAGDSAGANLALGALVALRNAGAALPATAALFYGCYAPDFETDSHRRLGGGEYLLSTAIMRWYWANFLASATGSPPDAAAPRTADLAGLPPLYLDAAGLDPLLDDTLDLARRLAEAGVRYRLDVVPGVVHGFLRMTNELPAAREALAAAGAHIARTLQR